MTTSQVVLGLACGSIAAPRAKASSVTAPRASLWMVCPVTPLVPGGPSGRRCPTPNRRISIGMAATRQRRRRRAGRRDPPRRRIVASGSANFCLVK